MKKINRILIPTVVGLVGISSLVGCGYTTKKSETKEDTSVEIDYNEDANEILLNYNEEGMDTLLANFTKSEDMEMALKNIGRVPSDFEYKTIDGKTLTIKNGKVSGYEDRNVIIEVAQVECEYCKVLSEEFNKALKDNEDVVLIPIFVNSTKDDIKNYYEELGIEMPETVIIDESKEIVNEFSLTKTPTSIFLDKTGKISYTLIGDKNEPALSEILDTAFGDKPIYTMLNTAE